MRNLKTGRKEGNENYIETFFYSLVSCENVAEVAAYRLGIVESQMIGHDFFSNDFSSMIFKPRYQLLMRIAIIMLPFKENSDILLI